MATLQVHRTTATATAGAKNYLVASLGDGTALFGAQNEDDHENNNQHRQQDHALDWTGALLCLLRLKHEDIGHRQRAAQTDTTT